MCNESTADLIRWTDQPLPLQEKDVNFHRLHTEIVPLAGGYLEVACLDMERPALQRHWQIRRVVDWKHVVWC